MDIWDWVRRVHGDLSAEGHDRLSQLVHRLPAAVCDNEHARVDAIVPEALALTRAIEHPWLEVFVRHWNLQSQILHRHHVDAWMGEAVALLEFANRPETRDCPQSVCVTQDLVNCYGNADGPGYAEERLAASRETLSRIDASWPCYCCIGGELVDALIDAGRPEEALAEIDRMEVALAATDEWDPDPMGDSRASILRELGRFDAALTLIDRLMDDPEDEDSRLARQIERARILVGLGRDDEARDDLPRFDAIAGTHSLYRGWVETVAALVLRGAIPHAWQIERRLRGIVVELAAIGVIRHAFEIGLIRAELALARGRPSTARRALDDARALVPRLRAPLDAPQKLAAVEQALNNAKDGAPAPESAEALLDTLGEDPEHDLERLLPALDRWPDHPRLTVAAAIAWRVLGELKRAEALLRRARAAADGPEPGVEIELGRLAAERGDWPAVRAIGERLATAPDDEAAAQGRGLVLLAARRTGDREAELSILRAEAAADPADPGAATRLADALADDDPAAALATLDALVARGVDPGPWDWRRILVATRLDAWPAVRDSATRLGMTLSGEHGPVQEDWEPVRISIEGGDEPQTVWASRTGPVTARVLTVPPPHEPCHYADEVIFDPLPLDGDDDEDAHYTYRRVAVRKAGGFRAFVVDARHPGEAAFEALSTAIAALGGTVYDVTGAHYVVTDPESGAQLPGLYARVAVPEDDLAALDACLTRVCADWPGPAVWTELLAALDADERMQAQLDLMERWGM